MDILPIDRVIIGLYAHATAVFWWTPLGFLFCIIVAWVAAGLLPEDFEVRISGREDLFLPMYERLGKLGLKSDSRMRILIAKEIVDVLRSGTLFKMLGSFAVPLLFLLLMAWGAEFAAFPIPFNLLSYAPFIGFFGFNFYSWLNAIDAQITESCLSRYLNCLEPKFGLTYNKWMRYINSPHGMDVR